MSNTLLTISMITREALRVLENNLKFASRVNRQYDEKFAVEGATIGTTLNIRKPPRYIGRTGATISSYEDTTETYVALTLSTQFGVDINFTSAELALSIDDFSERILKPAVATIANKIDRDGLALYKSIYNAVGVPGSVPDSLRTYLEAGALMDEEACPQDGLRNVVVSSRAQLEIVDALKGLFQASDNISQQYKSGRMGTAAGFEWMMDQNVNLHTAGSPATGAVTVKTTVSTDGQATVVLTGLTATTGTLKQGDIFTIDNVYAVNPQSRQSTGQLRRFVVTADGTADGSGDLTASVSPAMYEDDHALASIDTFPQAGAAVTFLSSNGQISTENLAFHRDAFCLGMADLPLPRGVDMAGRVSDKQLGMSIRLVRQYDITNDKFPCRMDVLYGYSVLYPQLACRISG